MGLLGSKTITSTVSYGFAELRLQSSCIDELHRFYEEVLELSVARVGTELFVETGATRIVFEQTPAGDCSPYYHFAWNICQNKILAARDWQRERTALLRQAEEEVVHFADWDAHSIFFEDPAGNILEYIARHGLNNGSTEKKFSSTDLLYVSEFGVVVEDVPSAVEQIQASLELPVYGEPSDGFAAMGDEHALLIVVQQGRKWAPNRERSANAYPAIATIRRPGTAGGGLQLSLSQLRTIR